MRIWSACRAPRDDESATDRGPGTPTTSPAGLDADQDLTVFGSFRMALAVGVVLSHMGVPIFGIHPGIVGVVCFFMVSGFAMSGLITASFPRLPQDVPAFYLDRVVRLAPQYYFYLAIAAVSPSI